jgi:ADP-ribose pyrophosphatase
MSIIQKWQRLASRIVYHTPFFSIRQDECRLPDGRTVSDYYVMQEPDIVMVFALTPARELLLVEQYKHGIGQICMELPAGMSESDDHLAEAQRELREETGYEAAEWQHWTTFIKNPTRNDNRLHLFYAADALQVGAQDLDANEAIRVHHVPITQIRDWLTNEPAHVIGSVACILYGLHKLSL